VANNSESNYVGSFVTTTDIWDVTQVYQVEDVSPAMRELLIRMYQNLNRMSLVLNTSTKGYYDIAGEFVDGNVWFPKPGLTSQTSRTPAFRQEIRTVLNLPQNGGGFALPIGITNTNHNITINNSTLFTQIYGCASDTIGFNYFPIPDTNIAIQVNQTQVVINNTSGINFTDCFVVLSYLQN
jgi:hypothetical protein